MTRSLAISSALFISLLLILGAIIRFYEISSGISAYNRKDYHTALSKLSPFSGWADGDAEANLGAIFLNGLDTRQNLDKAVGLIKKSAQAGSPFGEYLLGEIFTRGKGVYQDKATGAAWLQRAADQGFPRAEAALGQMLVNGDGVGIDAERAKRLLTDAANQGEPAGDFGLGMMYLDGVGVPQSYAIARKFLEVAAAHGVAEAENNLGVMYENGDGIPVDHGKSALHFGNALVLGLPQAALNLGELYLKGSGVERNTVTAYVIFSIGAGMGCKDCMADRDKVILIMTPDQILEGQKLASSWNVGKALPLSTSLESRAADMIFDPNASLNMVSETHVYFTKDFRVHKDALRVIFLVTKGVDCHACGAKLSAVTFLDLGSERPEGEAAARFTDVGSFGNAPVLDDPSAEYDSPRRTKATFLSYLDEKEFVLLPDSEMGQGETTTGVHVLAYSGDNLWRWQDIGFIILGDDNSGNCNDGKQVDATVTSAKCYAWHGKVEMNASPQQAWPDFIVHRIGTMLNSKNELEQAAEVIYRYNGKRYELAGGSTEPTPSDLRQRTGSRHDQSHRGP